MAKLFLSGGGSGEKSEILDKKFAEQLDKSKPLLYIPIAIDTNKHPYQECLKWLKNTFDKLGVKQYVLWDEKRIYDYKKVKIIDFSGIYIGGGNTPYLLKTLKDNGFWNFLKSAVKKSIPIYGGSAGAIIFAKTIIPSLNQDENLVDLKNFNGMNSIKNHDLWCHYNSEKETIVLNFMKKYKLQKIIALPEETGLIIDKNLIRVLGKSNAFLFEMGNKKEIKIGEIIK